MDVAEDVEVDRGVAGGCSVTAELISELIKTCVGNVRIRLVLAAAAGRPCAGKPEDETDGHRAQDANPEFAVEKMEYQAGFPF